VSDELVVVEVFLTYLIPIGLIIWVDVLTGHLFDFGSALKGMELASPP